MSKSSDIFGIAKFEYGAPGDGIMGATLVEYNDIKEATGVLKLPKKETVKIYSETRRGVPYKVISGGVTEGPMLNLEFLGLTLEDWNLFLGGTYAAGKWTFPKDDVDLFKSIRITTRPTDDAGTVLVFEIAYGLVTAGIDAAMTFNDLTPIQVTIEAMVPVSALDVEGDVLTVEEV